MKKSLSYDLEASNPSTKSLNNGTFNNINGFSSYSSNDFMHDTSSQQKTKDLIQNKPLRIEDFQYDKPNYSVVDEDLLNQVQTEFNHKVTASTQQQQLNASLTSEFNDCLQLLNEAESKIQNRSSPYVSKYQVNCRPQSMINSSGGSYTTTSILKSSTILPDKYTRPQSSSTQVSQRTSNVVDSFNHNGHSNSNSNISCNSKLLQYSPSPLLRNNESSLKSASVNGYEGNSIYNAYRSPSVDPSVIKANV